MLQSNDACLEDTILPQVSCSKVKNLTLRFAWSGEPSSHIIVAGFFWSWDSEIDVNSHLPLARLITKIDSFYKLPLL